MVSVRIHDGGNQKLQKCHSWAKGFSLRPVETPYEFLLYFMKYLCFPAFHFPFILKFTPKVAQAKPRNYWCPFNTADVGTRWCIALGLAGYTKLNFNVNEQLNDWGLIHTHGLFTGLKMSKLNCHKHLVQNYSCGFEIAAHFPLVPWANLNVDCLESGTCMCLLGHISHSKLSVVLWISG